MPIIALHSVGVITKLFMLVVSQQFTVTLELMFKASKKGSATRIGPWADPFSALHGGSDQAREGQRPASSPICR